MRNDIRSAFHRILRQTVIVIELGKYSPSVERAFRFARYGDWGVEDVSGWE
ncbi:MAG: hypothetical protein AB8B60_06805 [Sulfitobacter sp.]